MWALTIIPVGLGAISISSAELVVWGAVQSEEPTAMDVET